MKRISIVFLGTTGSGPVYSYEMARALASSGRCKLQIIISEDVKNLISWEREFKNKEGIDFCVVQTYKHNKLSVILSFFNIKKMRHVVTLIKSFKPDCLYAPFRIVWSPYIYNALKGKVRIVSTLHDPHPHDGGGGGLGKISHYMFDRSLRHTDDIIILNNIDRTYVTQKFGKPIIVIPHASFSQCGIPKDNNCGIKNTIGFFGRIEPYKGLDVLVEAFSQIKTPNVHLLIAGSGRIDDNIKVIIDSNPNIALINRYIEEEEIPELMNQVDFIVLPYKTATQSGVIPLSFAYGKPVIATNVGALDEQVPQGTGVLTKVNSFEIAKEIDLLYDNKERIKAMSVEAKKYAEDVLTWERSASILLDYLG